MASHSRLKPPTKRSGSLEPWSGRACIASYVHCLHLLDLDLLDDWPHITVQTLSTRSSSQNLQLRIRAVEWSLFRLYELYDAQTARDKLRPFFPPQNQLQSQNLRAALLRVLTDLKKAGVLEKDVVLRKTIFDECKGEKFEELLAGFAGLVLERQGHLKYPAIAALAQTSEENILPLIVAYRQSIQANLHRRAALRKKLLDHENELTLRRERLSQTKKEIRRHENVPSDACEQIEHVVRESWTADPAWVDALLHGFPPGKSLLHQGGGSANSHNPTTKLEAIQDLMTDQNARLQRWASFRSSLPTTTREFTERKIPVSSTNMGIKFSKHQSLLPRGANELLRGDDHDISDPCRRYHDLLRRFRREMQPEQAQATHAAAGPAASPAFDAAGPIAPNESFSTVDDTKLRADLKLDPQSFAQDSASDSPGAVATLPVTTQFDAKVSSVAGHSSSHIQASSSEGTWIPAAHTLPTVGPIRAPESPRVSERETEREIDSSPPVTPMPVSRPSLQERTRMSLAGALRDLKNAPESPSVLDKKSSVSDRAALSPVYASTTSDLAQRTRKSMNLLTTLSELKSARRVSRGPRTSQLYPVNPFETPRKSSLHLDVNTPDTGESTPREKLFSEDADMSSVFKSRPKIALSPLISPDRSILEDDSILASRADAMNLDEESDTGTPTRG